MRIAVPTTTSNQVDEHFGHCEFYTIFTINDNNEIDKTEILPSPAGCGCKSNIAFTLREIGVKVLLAGNMGAGAVNVINGQGIEVVRGNKGDVTSVVNNFINGKVIDSGLTCDHHDHGHEHGHNHSCNH